MCGPHVVLVERPHMRKIPVGVSIAGGPRLGEIVEVVLHVCLGQWHTTVQKVCRRRPRDSQRSGHTGFIMTFMCRDVNGAD